LDDLNWNHLIHLEEIQQFYWAKVV
jgi:hypothetical protein